MSSLKPAASLYVDYKKSLKIINTIFLCWGFLTIVNFSLLGTFTKAVPLVPGTSTWDFFLGLENLTGGLVKFTKHPSVIFSFIFFATYFICGLPAGYIVHKKGLKNSIETGLIVAASAVLLIVPGVRNHSYGLLCAGIFVVASGFTILQVACNPYVIFVGKPEEGSARLSIAGAHNSFGSWMAPLIGTLISVAAVPEDIINPAKIVEYQTELVVLPYVLITVIFIGMTVLIHFSDLPEMDHFRDIDTNVANDSRTSIFQYRHVWMGFFAILAYVMAEVMIAGKIIAPYLSLHIKAPELASSIGLVASYFVGCMMVGRFVGASILRKTPPRRVLIVCGVFSAILSLICAVIPTQEALFFILAIGLFIGVMWPIIFDLAVRGMGSKMPYVSAFLVMGIIGAAIAIYLFEGMYVPIEDGLEAHKSSISKMLLLTVVPCYAFIAYYGIHGYKYEKKADILKY